MMSDAFTYLVPRQLFRWFIHSTPRTAAPCGSATNMLACIRAKCAQIRFWKRHLQKRRPRGFGNSFNRHGTTSGHIHRPDIIVDCLGAASEKSWLMRCNPESTHLIGGGCFPFNTFRRMRSKPNSGNIALPTTRA